MASFGRNTSNVCACEDKKSLVVSYLLLIFLGCTGAHHFYLGRRMFGMMYFLTFGLCGFGYLVDYFRLPGLVEAANDKLFTPDEEIDSKNNSDAYVLWFPCGIIGFHHFYLGNYHLGLLYLVTFGVYGVGWTIDFFRIPSLVCNSNIPPDMMEKTNSLTTTYLMTLSPFGILGAQHYYLRRWRWGLLYTCTGGIFIFGWLFDVFRIPNLVSRENKKLKGENVKWIYTDDVYLLWLPLGIFGAHHYFLGRKTLALAYLVTLGFLGCGWLIDLFRIPYLVATKNYHIEKEEITDNKISFFHQVIYQSDEEQINNVECRRQDDLSIFLKRNNNAFAETCNQEQLVFNARPSPLLENKSDSKAVGKLGPKKPTRFSYTTTMVETFTLDDEIDENLIQISPPGMLGRDFYSSAHKNFTLNENLERNENPTKQKFRRNKSRACRKGNGKMEINCSQDGTMNKSVLPSGEVPATRINCFKEIESLTCSAICNKHLTDSTTIAKNINSHDPNDAKNKPKSRKATEDRVKKDTDDILFKPRKGLENSFDQNGSESKNNVALVSKTYQPTNAFDIREENISKSKVQRRRKRQNRSAWSSDNVDVFVKSESQDITKKSTMAGTVYVENMNTELQEYVGCKATAITNSNSVRFVHKNYPPGHKKDNENQLISNQQPQKQSFISSKSKDCRVYLKRSEENEINLNTEKNMTAAGRDNISVVSIARHPQTEKPPGKFLFVNAKNSHAIAAQVVENIGKESTENREYCCNEVVRGDRLNYRQETSVSLHNNDKRWSIKPVQKSRDHHAKVSIQKSKGINTLTSKESFNETNANTFLDIEQARKLRKRPHRTASKSVRKTNHEIASEEDISKAHYNNISSGNVNPQAKRSVKIPKTPCILPAYCYENKNDVMKTNGKMETMRPIKKKTSSLNCDTEIPNDNRVDFFVQNTRKISPLTQSGYDKILKTRKSKKEMTVNHSENKVISLSKLHHTESGIVRDSGLMPRKIISASVPNAEGDVYSMNKNIKNDVMMKIEQGRHDFNKKTNAITPVQTPLSARELMQNLQWDSDDDIL